MVAVIGSGVSIKRTFLYNENKVKEGVAECLMAGNYPVDVEQLDEKQRLNMLLKTAALNPDVKRSSIHISLNFAPGEDLSDSKLKEIACDYMEQIGFGNQPFLVYRHDDTAHPHIHIATTLVRPEGSRINTYNIGRNLSEPARKAIENRYGLVKAEDQKKQLFTLKPVNAGKVNYGEEPSKKAINNVLQSVLTGYKFTSLPELNAVLNQYNISADRGSEQSRIYQHRGLIYHILDTNGKAVGVPVKASAFYNNPGLKFLENQYLKNDVARQPHRARVKNTIDIIMLRNPKMTLQQLADKLKGEGIHVTIRQNAEGQIYGLTYVDHRTKCVFNGSTLGKAYSAKGILERLGNPQEITSSQARKPSFQPASNKNHTPIDQLERTVESADDSGLLEQLMQHEYSSQNVPYDWKRKKKRKKKR